MKNIFPLEENKNGLLNKMKSRDLISFKPIKIKFNSLAWKKLIKNHPELILVDEYENQLKELMELRNPHFRFEKPTTKDFQNFLAKIVRNKSLNTHGNWFYFPWFNQLIHYLPIEFHQELRTTRNKFLITQKEQQEFYGTTIGILGMSVGSHVALTIVMTGGAEKIKLADLDSVSGSNLNRIRSGFGVLGVNKAVSIARQIYEINPYAQVEIYPTGINDQNIYEFVDDLDLLIEETDNPYVKIKSRFIARNLKIPVIMAADNGDGIIVDVERYDLNKNYPILHGLLGKMTPEDFKKILPRNLPKVIAKMAGAPIADIRMLESVVEVGKKIYSWPQLGTAATMCGTILAYLARNIMIGNLKIKSGRYQVNPNSIFEFGFNSKAALKKRDLIRKKILKNIGLQDEK